MEIQLHLILTGCIVASMLIPVKSHSVSHQIVSRKLTNDGEVGQNFQNLFNSIAKNDPKTSRIYRGNVEQEVAREQHAFDEMNEELFYASWRNNANKQRNYYSKNSNPEQSIIAKKRDANGPEKETQQDSESKSPKVQNDTENISTAKPETTLATLPPSPVGITSVFNAESRPTVAANIKAFGREKVLDIFPGKNKEDTYSAALFREYTGMDATRVSRRSVKKIHGFIQKPDFRGFIREMNIYARKVPFGKLVKNPGDNNDGLYFRAAFYLLLRAFNFKPTDYFYDLMQKHNVITVETPLTVFIFAVNIGSHVDHDFNVTMNLVDGKSGHILPRDSKTILCAGILFDTQFDPKIRHFRAVLRDKTRIKINENAPSYVTLTPVNV